MGNRLNDVKENIQSKSLNVEVCDFTEKIVVLELEEKRTLPDVAKEEFLQENWGKITLKQLESLV